MSVEEKLDALIKMVKKDGYENRMYIAWSFAVSTLSLAVARVTVTATIVSLVVAIAFALIGWYYWMKAHTVK